METFDKEYIEKFIKSWKCQTDFKNWASQAGWPDLAIFHHLGDCLLWADFSQLTGFDLTTHNTAIGDDSIRPRRQGLLCSSFFNYRIAQFEVTFYPQLKLRAA
jgi:hypothetical protein